MQSDSSVEAFWAWTADRHRWEWTRLRTVVRPSVLTSVGAMIKHMTDPGDGVILQPPVRVRESDLTASRADSLTWRRELSPELSNFGRPRDSPA